MLYEGHNEATAFLATSTVTQQPAAQKEEASRRAVARPGHLVVAAALRRQAARCQPAFLATSTATQQPTVQKEEARRRAVARLGHLVVAAACRWQAARRSNSFSFW